jgi:tripartite-type tricarboxylate transporter receptor subunit TctC
MGCAWIRAAVIAAGFLLAGAAAADTYPNKLIKLVVPYAPGGPTDIVGRVLADKLAQLYKSPVIVENKPGGGANIGAENVANAPADGYTLLVATSGHAINVTVFPKLKYSLLNDFAPVSLLTSGPLVLVASPDLPAKTLPELVDLAKKRSEPLSFASSGNGASTHLAGEMFNLQAGIKSIHVPYRGSGPALLDVMSGQVSYMFDTTLSAMPLVQAGKLRAIAVTSAKRSAVAPELPTVAELGYPSFEAASWYGLLAPSKAPPEIVAKLNADLRTVLEMGDVKEKFAAQGFAAEWQPMEVFGSFLRQEVERWGAIARSADVKID